MASAQEVFIDTSYITLGQFLKFVGIIGAGFEAKNFLLNNLIKVNTISENRRGKKLYVGDLIEIKNKFYVIKTKGEING